MTAEHDAADEDRRQDQMRQMTDDRYDREPDRNQHVDDEDHDPCAGRRAEDAPRFAPELGPRARGKVTRLRRAGQSRR